MHIGLDFDNTIVSYDKAIKRLSSELKDIPKGVERTKVGIRDFLRASGRESEWTMFQGRMYGPGMKYAEPFKGAIETMERLEKEGNELSIISHRSRFPYAGTKYDLHEAAKNWIAQNIRKKNLFMSENSSINFLETKSEKIECIQKNNCQAFVDDLPEILKDKDFPARTLGILFDPNNQASTPARCMRITIWPELISQISNIN